jgi:hypothetical protein
MMRKILVAVLLTSLAVPGPAAARIHDESDNSFVVRQGVSVPATPEEVWQVLVRPSQWWDDAHTFSGDAANLSLHPRAGGCFCEIIPGKANPGGAPAGSVEHMRVIYAEDGRALRLSGALGQMQADAVTGVLTIVVKAAENGTQILWEYAVFGQFRKPGSAEAVDRLLAGQILRLAEQFATGKPSGWIESIPDDGDTAPKSFEQAFLDGSDPDGSDPDGEADDGEETQSPAEVPAEDPGLFESR